MSIDGFEEYSAFSAITVDKEGLNIRSLSASMNADGAESRLTNQTDNQNLSNAYASKNIMAETACRINIKDMTGNKHDIVVSTSFPQVAPRARSCQQK